MRATSVFDDIYRDKKVLITGHTGFKGSWLTLWLKQLGANTCGFSLKAPTSPSHSRLLALGGKEYEADIANRSMLSRAFNDHQPEVVFHLAAQPLVRESYKSPIETYQTNVMGTLNILEAVRNSPSVRGLVVITTDKVYDNQEWHWGYRESDALGGYDPYSSSKACSEFVVSSYRNSFFTPHAYGKDHSVLVATARAGNVIGGGDWADDRIVPDLMRAASTGAVTPIRSPSAVRPWQHVLEPLSGYLLLGQRLLEADIGAGAAWNFGPGEDGNLCVGTLAEILQSSWDSVRFETEGDSWKPHEAGLLKLDCSKARASLEWSPVWDTSGAIIRTGTWYKNYYESGRVSSQGDLSQYVQDARAARVGWAGFASGNNPDTSSDRVQ